MARNVPGPFPPPSPPPNRPQAAPAPQVARAPQAAAGTQPAPLPPPPLSPLAREDAALAALLDEDARHGPSLPVVLLSAAMGMAAGIVVFYVAYRMLTLRLEISVGLAVLALCFGVGGTGALLSAALGSRAALPSIGLSCLVIVAALLVFGLCMGGGALAAAMLIALGS